jgi:peptidoglycan/xylan/chitin deacetylase (PgdA/CDA1 family)
MNRILLKLIALYSKMKLGEHPLGILYFHRVLEKPDPYFSDDPSIKEFIRLITFLKRFFNVLSLDDAIQHRLENTLPPLSLCLTFDDGFKDNYDIALPILQDFGVKAAFFIATQGLDDGILWNGKITHAIRHTDKRSITLDCIQTTFSINSEKERIETSHQLITKAKFSPNALRDRITEELLALADVTAAPREMLACSDVKNLDSMGHIIGAHTHTHSILGFQDKDTAEEEISISKALLNSALCKEIDHFAFPNGLLGRDFTQEHMNMIHQHGFRYGYSTNDGGYISKTNNLSIPRFLPYRRTLPAFGFSTAKIMSEYE